MANKTTTPSPVRNEVQLTNAQAKTLLRVKAGETRKAFLEAFNAKNFQLGEGFQYVRRRVNSLGGANQNIDLVLSGDKAKRGICTFESGKFNGPEQGGSIAAIGIRFAREADTVTSPSKAGYSATSISGDFKALLNCDLVINIAGKVVNRVPLSYILPASASPLGLVSDETNVYELPIPALYYKDDTVQVSIECSDDFEVLTSEDYSYFVEVFMKTVTFNNK